VGPNRGGRIGGESGLGAPGSPDLVALKRSPRPVIPDPDGACGPGRGQLSGPRSGRQGEWHPDTCLNDVLDGALASAHPRSRSGLLGGIRRR
jgi:hypothetical protein